MQIKCNGQQFNPCHGLTDAETRAAFDMYVWAEAGAVLHVHA